MAGATRWRRAVTSSLRLSWERFVIWSGQMSIPILTWLEFRIVMPAGTAKLSTENPMNSWDHNLFNSSTGDAVISHV